MLERGVREVLARARLREFFKDAEIGNDDLHVHVPFVHMRDGLPALAIKPLDLANDDPNQIFDHGGHWVDRVRRLRKHKLLPDEMLFAVTKPADAKARSAADEIVGELREQGVEVVLATDAQAIADFARAATH